MLHLDPVGVLFRAILYLYVDGMTMKPTSLDYIYHYVHHHSKFWAQVRLMHLFPFNYVVYLIGLGAME